MENNMNTPKIRFKGFDEHWEKKKFDEVFDILSNNTLSRDNLNNEQGSTQNVHYGDILVKFGEYTDTDEESLPYITDEEVAAKLHNSLLKDGDVIIADTAEDATVGKCTEIGNVGDKKIVSGLHTIPCRPKVDMAPQFMGYYMNSNAYHNKLFPLMQGVKVISISKSGLKTTKVEYPRDLLEQKKIGMLLAKIDRIISQEQMKLEKLKTLRLSMLDKLFPQEDSQLPSIRFEQFDKKWERFNLSEFVSDFVVPMRDKPRCFDGDIPWTRIEDIDGKYLNDSLTGQYVSRETVRDMNLKIIPKDSLIVSSSATFGTVAIVKQDLITNQTFIGLVIKDKETLDFWYMYFQSKSARNYMKLQSAGSTIFYIARESFERMPVLVPDRNEMIKIGKYFASLDAYIDSQTEKIEKLRNIKSASMKNMFV